MGERPVSHPHRSVTGNPANDCSRPTPDLPRWSAETSGVARRRPLSVTRRVARPRQKAVIRFEAHMLQYLTAEQNFNRAVRIADRGYVMLHLQITFEGTNELNNNEWYGSF